MAPEPPVTGPETVGLAADAAAARCSPPSARGDPDGQDSGEKSNPHQRRYVASARAQNGI